jgi:hypothetical protein
MIEWGKAGRHLGLPIYRGVEKDITTCGGEFRYSLLGDLDGSRLPFRSAACHTFPLIKATSWPTS